MKKTEFISFRTDAETKEALDRIAGEKKWTISFTVEEIVKDWLSKQEEQKDTFLLLYIVIEVLKIPL